MNPTGLSPRPPADMLDLRPDGAFRPPNYRWQLASLLVAGVWVPEDWIDRWTRLAEEALTTPPAPCLDAPDLRAVEAARELSERGPFWLKVEVEARMLAGEPADAIAAKTGLTPAAVEAYAELFYSVGDRLRHPGYVVHQVIRLYAPGAETDVGVQVRMLGFKGGPLVLDAVLDAVAGPRAGTEDDDSAGEPGVRRLARLAVGLRTTPVTEANAVTWARLYALVRECEALGVRPR